jgi:hypothetical protein
MTDKTKPKRKSPSKTTTIFQAFCLALSLENWDGATVLLKLDAQKGDIRSMEKYLAELSKKQSFSFPSAESVFGAIAADITADNPPPAGEKED